MPTHVEIFQSGLEALNQERYLEAVSLLENYCQICETIPDKKFKEFFEAQAALVKAYHFTGQHQKARLRCQQLAESNNPQVQAWAQRILQSLPAESSVATPADSSRILLTSEQAAELLAAGNKALKFRRYDDAVKALEEFCQGTDTAVKNYEQAQMCLVKAYKGNQQVEKAIALCQQLTNSNQEVTQIWAQKFLLTLLPESSATSTSIPETTSQPMQPEEKAVSVKMTMRSVNEFKLFCQNNLLTDLKEVEAARKITITSIIVVTIIIFIIFGILIKLFPIQYIIFCFVAKLTPPYLLIFIFLLVFLACLWGWVAFYTSAVETYTSGFKSKIIPKIFDFINTNQNLNYSSSASDADNQYTMSAFIHSQIFPTLIKPNKLQQNECIFGKVNETLIFFSEISAEVEVQHHWVKYLTFSKHLDMLHSLMVPGFITRIIFGALLPLYSILLLIKLLKSVPYIASKIVRGKKISYEHFEQEVLKNEVTRQTIFKGLFFQAEFNKIIRGRTIVLPNLLNTNIHALNNRKEKAIKLEDPEFAQYFTVYGNDQVESRYVLSTNLMAKLVKFRKKAKKNFYVSFVENMIYIAIDYPDGIFEPKLFTTMLSFAPMREYFENIQLMLDIVEDLNLNRDIWAKH